jgi:hypothetical protein
MVCIPDLHPVTAAITAEVERFEAAQLVDEGEDEAEITARRRKLIVYRSRIIDKNILKLAMALEERGLVDKRGKLRTTWLAHLESLVNTAVRIDNLLGLERRARRLEEALRQAGEADDVGDLKAVQKELAGVGAED